MRYARECLSWDGKAQIDDTNLELGGRQGPKPDLQPRKDAAPTANRQNADLGHEIGRLALLVKSETVSSQQL